ncbi:aminoglycoside 6-adenylyltransferase [Carnobacterium divergens]|uniref:Uncharacterized protein n=1 Tax=Carnobacterium divergens TaxID=2748 RepID=A0A7Z8CZW6_CARDV|nr:aminoglycoside 6-adenylyltransferase [Carnobacterium divergens]TFI73560.1 hypothetical protein CKN58_06180 [Carnobacterium divergens]TFI77507.1 hypothetical protein CKN85_06175 [Carnobacterium divergens]TFI84270.1 hypothetical protein CKN56_06215 [Carnobacterium divergens]TFI96117.1 hypothetical protein CKN64_06155 [Carnobacterium divergens]TFJ12420.1 hypothetical protein CKN60_06220 [Carnobacterium divergens]
MLNVLKAYQRNEMLVAIEYLNVTRSELIRMLFWQKLLSSFETTSKETLYKSLLTVRALFNEVSFHVAEIFNYPFQNGEEIVAKFLECHR